MSVSQSLITILSDYAEESEGILLDKAKSYLQSEKPIIPHFLIYSSIGEFLFSIEPPFITTIEEVRKVIHQVCLFTNEVPGIWMQFYYCPSDNNKIIELITVDSKIRQVINSQYSWNEAVEEWVMVDSETKEDFESLKDNVPATILTAIIQGYSIDSSLFDSEIIHDYMLDQGFIVKYAEGLNAKNVNSHIYQSASKSLEKLPSVKES